MERKNAFFQDEKNNFKMTFNENNNIPSEMVASLWTMCL